MQYPHWLMVAGAVLVVLGFLGLYCVAGTLSPIKSPMENEAKGK